LKTNVTHTTSKQSQGHSSQHTTSYRLSIITSTLGRAV